MNESLATIAARYGQALAVASKTPVRPEDFCFDGFHPSARGYAALAEAIAPALQGAVEALRKEAERGVVGREDASP